MKILQVNNVYGEKSTGKLTKLLHDGIRQQGWESVVVYGRGKNTADAGVIRLCPDWYGKLNSLISRFTGIPYGGCLLSTFRLTRIILREKPDVVHLQCINGHFVNIYRLIRWLKKQQIKTVVSLHAEFMYTGNCGHAYDCMQWRNGCEKCPDVRRANKSIFFDRTGTSWRAMKDAFNGFEESAILCPVSPWTEDRGKQSGIVKKFRFHTVFNGLDTDVFSYREKEGKEEKLVLVVTAHFSADPDHGKGGWQLMQLAKQMPDVTFLVAGRADAVEALPKNIRLLGMISSQQELAALYGKSKLSLQISRRETFSMPCAESLCCGTPVVGFRAGAPEQIALPQYSEFVEYGDIGSLERTVRNWLSREDLDYRKIAAEAECAYSAKRMVRQFLEIYGGNLWN